MSHIAQTAIIHPNVILADNITVGEYVIIGEPPRGKLSGELKTTIGANSIIRSHTVIYAGNRIGVDFQTGHHVMIREENDIGDAVSIGTNSVIEHHVIIKTGARIHSNVFVPEYSILHEDTWLGPNAVITNAMYPLSPDAKRNLKGATLLYGAKVGANCTLLPGITIGENALIGAGSVVTKDVPPNKVMAGNPAREINDISNLPYGG